MRQERHPRIGGGESRHQKIEQSQKINIDRANAFVTLMVRRENVSDVKRLFLQRLRVLRFFITKKTKPKLKFDL